MKIFKRNEFFGSILYDPVEKEYYCCDKFTTFLLDNDYCNKQEVPEDEILNRFDVTIDEYESAISDLRSLVQGREITIIHNQINNGILSAPLRVFLDFTYECNLRCVHCFTKSANKKNDELTFLEKKSIVDQMVYMGCYRISIAGGEPLMSDDFFPFVEYARSNDIDVSFTTNGTLITHEIIKKLNELRVRTITISLEGANRDDNDIIRGKGSFDSVMEKISLLSEHYDGRVALRMTMMKHNIHNAEEYIRLAERINCRKVKFNALRLTGRACENAELLLNPDEYVDFIRDTESHTYNNVKVILPLNPFQKDEYEHIDGLGFGCVAGKDCMTISPEGFVRPCSQLDYSHADGNCKFDALIDIWNKGKVFNFYRSLEGNPTCKECTVYDKCRGGCRYRALQAGNVNGIDPYCYMKRFEGDSACNL